MFGHKVGCKWAAGWGGWAFEVDELETGGGGSTVRHGACSATAPCLKFSKGGFQEARGNKGCGDMCALFRLPASAVC